MAKKEQILNIPISLLNEEKIIQTLYGFIKNRERGRVLFCANPHSIVESLKDEEFFKALNCADILLPDGIGVVLASKILKKNLKRRISGPDIFINFSKFINDNGGCRYYFLGSTDGVLKKMEERMQNLFPEIEVVGTYSPPFGEWSEEDEKIITLVNERNPDVLWVGMTAPKQEKWVYRNKDKLNVSLIGAIGAAFDFFAGTKKRAPKWMREIGLEWLSRFLQEPKRLWRRYLVSIPVFIYLVFKERFKHDFVKKTGIPR